MTSRERTFEIELASGPYRAHSHRVRCGRLCVLHWFAMVCRSVRLTAQRTTPHQFVTDLRGCKLRARLYRALYLLAVRLPNVRALIRTLSIRPRATALRSSCSTSQSRTQERRAFRSVASVSPYFSLLDWSSMSSQTKVSSSVPVRQSEFAVAQKARASALERADSERAQKRLDSDARLDVNASKWRYVCPGT